MMIKVDRCCEHCNSVYELTKHNPNPNEFIHNFGDCPHCHKRNDVWILVKINQDEKNETPQFPKTT